MNRFPVPWVVRVAIPALRGLPRDRLAFLMHSIRTAPMDSLIPYQGWTMVASLIVPTLLIVAIPMGTLLSASRGTVAPPFMIAVFAPLLLLSIYASSCLFTYVNARLATREIMRLLAQVHDDA